MTVQAGSGPQVVALSGGVGGAKLALGLAQVLPEEELLIVANTGDDFEHLGFHISPDLDTLIYTLAGVSNPDTGWGLADESWSFMDQLELEQPDKAWFRLGDKDLDTHRFRTDALAEGRSLSDVAAELAARFGVAAAIVPMSDDPVQTFVQVEREGVPVWLPFQEYFVKHRCQPAIEAIEYRGASQARLQPAVESALTGDSLGAVVLCPSNPFLSIDPILALPGLVELLRSCGAPVVAVSPVVGGRALKGPTAKIMAELGMPVDVLAIAAHYRGIIDALVIDRQDQGQLQQLTDQGLKSLATATVMTSLADRVQLARDVLDFAAALQAG